MLNSAARTRGKSASYRLPALFQSEDALVRPCLCAHEEERFVRQPQALRQGLGNQGRLIVSALSLAFPVAPARRHRLRIYRARFALPQQVARQTSDREARFARTSGRESPGPAVPDQLQSWGRNQSHMFDEMAPDVPVSATAREIYTVFPR